MIITLILILITGCSDSKKYLGCGVHLHNESWKEDCNTCFCNDGQVSCTEIGCNPVILKDENLIQKDNTFKEKLNEWKFNSNLTDSERVWLSYLEIKYPNTKIIHMKSKVYSGEENYDLYFKKDRTIVKIKVLGGELKQESITVSDIVPLIENSEICSLFGGKWNECPRPCSTDEEACITMCNPPICEFDENLIVYKKENEQCGGFDKGDCEYGLSCYYENKEDDYGMCKKRD